jgi:Zn-dependent alcohol dehydrogenase
MEGLTMYLSAEEVAGLFSSIRRLETPDATVAFTFMEPQSDGHVNFPQASRLVTWWLRRRGEPFTWGIGRADVAGFLAELGFQQIEQADEKVLRGSYMGSCVPRRDIPRFVELYRQGRLPVDRLRSATLPLDEINAGFTRLAAGQSVRDVVVP